ncbi:hypothetical protein PanWU01x14_013060, partial [Parasponia andersonii]
QQDAGSNHEPLDSRWGTPKPLGGIATTPLPPSRASAPLQVHDYALDTF